MDREQLRRLRDAHRKSMHVELERVRAELIAAGAELVILFGSAAEGELGLFSDIDLLVVIPSDLDFLPRIRDLYARICPREMDIFPYTPVEFERLKDTNSFVRSAFRKGKVIYEKAA